MCYYYSENIIVKTEQQNDSVGEEITENEYNAIVEAIKTPSTAPDGYYYAITKDCQWELRKIEYAEHPQPEEGLQQ